MQLKQIDSQRISNYIQQNSFDFLTEVDFPFSLCSEVTLQ